VSTVAEEDGGVASRRRTVVALKRMGSNGLKNRPRWEEDREELRVLASSAHDCNEEKLSKSFDRS
jgi:hypothetical protein